MHKENIPVTQRLSRLRAQMRSQNLAACLLLSADPHGSEYLAEHYKARAYFSGFTGSAGVLAVLLDKAALFTDGRYFLQAEEELASSGIDLMRMGEVGTPTFEEYLLASLPPHATVCAWGETLSHAQAQSLRMAFKEKEITLLGDTDIAGQVWQARPPLPDGAIEPFPLRYAGQSMEEKTALLWADTKRAGGDALLLTTLDEIAWLCNLRGGDIAHNPVAFAFAIVEEAGVTLFLDAPRLTVQARNALQNVTLHPYRDVYRFAPVHLANKRVLVDPRTINDKLYCALAQKTHLIEAESPAMLQKAQKNPVEQENARQAHVKDGVALVRLLCWLKNNIGKRPIYELDVAAQIDSYRAAWDTAKGPSFPTIAAYGAHGALAHYSANARSNALLLPKGLFLLDSGGQYLEGTTDVTRTIALGPLTAEEKLHFTLVFQGMCALSRAIFPHGCTPQNLDAFARAPLWAHMLDYRHGTGHGVGHYLNVHEPPIRFDWRTPSTGPLLPGMQFSNEPGLYFEGRYGIRTENQLFVQPYGEGAYGPFLHFETLTLAPIDLQALDIAMLNEAERTWLNAYHRRVYEALHPYLNEEEAEWLQSATRAI